MQKKVEILWNSKSEPWFVFAPFLVSITHCEFNMFFLTKFLYNLSYSYSPIFHSLNHHLRIRRRLANFFNGLFLYTCKISIFCAIVNGDSNTLQFADAYRKFKDLLVHHARLLYIHKYNIVK